MALPNDKTTMNTVVDKSIKHKLQVLADADGLKLSPYVNQKLREVIEEFEYQIIETYGSSEFLQTYYTIFGADYPPEIPFDFEEEVDEEAARRNLISAINSMNKKSVTQRVGRVERMPTKEIKERNREEPSDN